MLPFAYSKRFRKVCYILVLLEVVVKAKVTKYSKRKYSVLERRVKTEASEWLR